MSYGKKITNNINNTNSVGEEKSNDKGMSELSQPFTEFYEEEVDNCTH